MKLSPELMPAVSAAGNTDYKPFGHEVAGTVLETGGAVKNISVGRLMRTLA
jgi:D-arabinose 1-dehydrogenase-like Zn-dependent alcohol dehydrogenase